MKMKPVFFALLALAQPALAAPPLEIPPVVPARSVECLLEPHKVVSVGSPVDGVLHSVSVDRGVLDAPGGAVRSGGNWFHLRYHCAVAADIASVSAFEYALGAPIPPDQWEEHFLNGDDDGLD